MVCKEIVHHGHLLRNTTSTILLPFLAPSVPTSWLRPLANASRAPKASLWPARSLHVTVNRCNETNSQSKQPTDSRATSFARSTGPGEDKGRSTQTGTVKSRREMSAKEEMEHHRKELDNLLSSQFGNRTNSAEDVAFAFREHHKQRQGETLERMNFPQTKPLAANSEALRSLETNRQIQNRAAGGDVAPRNVRTVLSRPRVGRSVDISPSSGVDFGRALAQLGAVIRDEGVRQDQRHQRFHERPGTKRKRLRMVRWRRHFKLGFNAMVARAKQMKKQGW